MAPPKTGALLREKERGKRKQQQLPARQREKGLLPYGKRTDFGYEKDFKVRYSIGKLLGHGQFGYTYVAVDSATGERVAVKRLEKSKVCFLLS